MSKHSTESLLLGEGIEVAGCCVGCVLIRDVHSLFLTTEGLGGGGEGMSLCYFI